MTEDEHFRPSQYPSHLNLEEAEKRALALIEAHCLKMRHLAVAPGSPDEAAMAEMRTRLDALVLEAWPNVLMRKTIRAAVFGSLHPASIMAHCLAGSFSFSKPCWAGLAPHITPEVIEAFCVSGRRLQGLPLFMPGYALIPEGVAVALFDHMTSNDTMFLIRIIRGAGEQIVSPGYALKAIRYWMEHWGPPHWSETSRGEVGQSLTILRLVASQDGWRGDDWSPSDMPHCTRALELTRSAHGRLQLLRLVPDPEEFLLRPKETLSRLASHQITAG